MDTRVETEADDVPIENWVDPNNKRQYSRAISDTIGMCDLRTLEKLLKLRGQVGIDDRYPGLSYPIHIAAAKGAVRCVKLLLKYGHNIEEKDSSRRTPLVVAIDNRELECAQLLLEKGARVQLDSYTEKPPLWHAICKDDAEMVQLLLDNGAKFVMNPMLDQNRLNFETLSENPKALQVLCEHGLALQYSDNDKRNLLMWLVAAPREMHASLSVCIPIAVEKGIDLQAKDSQGWTALTYACEHGNAEGIKSLLAAGAGLQDEGTALEGHCLLFRVIRTDNLEAIKSLLQGATPEALQAWQNEAKSRVVHLTVWKDNVDILRVLLKHSWPILKTGPDGKDSILHLVAGIQGRRVLSKRCFKYLLKRWLKKGYSLGLEDYYTCTPLFKACSAWNLDEVEMLLKAGADPHLGHRDGTQPMTGALKYALFPNSHWFPHVHNAVHPSLQTPSNGQDPPAYPVLGSATLLFDFKCSHLQVSEIMDNLLQNAEQACELVRSAGRYHRSFIELDNMCEKVHSVVKDLVMLLYSGFTGDKYTYFYIPLLAAVSDMPTDQTLYPFLNAEDSWVKALAQPCSMKRLCRDSIRSSIHPCSNIDTISSLGLPHELEKYVLVQHEFDQYIQEIIEILKV